MRRMCAVVVVLATLSLPAVVGSQGQRTLSAADLVALEGTWVLDVVRSRLTASDDERRVIKLGPTWLRLDIYRPTSPQPIALIYNLDGSDNVNAFGSDTAVTKLRREGERMLLETIFTVNNQPVTAQELMPLVPSGLDLPVEVILRVEHGYQGVAPPGASAGTRTPPNVSNGIKIFQKQP
jgi:hypothetical protein